ncbi:PH domain-containing protein, partial [Streptomyces sp. SID3343]|uniref:PH domain-containing protein n=1 Tax=Streptomyces sp. SID3343 TaxID=2690260 RepID=UPI001369A57F
MGHPETLRSPWRFAVVGLGLLMCLIGLATASAHTLTGAIYFATGAVGVVQGLLCGVRILPKGLVHRGVVSRRTIRWDDIVDINTGAAEGSVTPSNMPKVILADGRTVGLSCLAGHATSATRDSRVQLQTT